MRSKRVILAVVLAGATGALCTGACRNAPRSEEHGAPADGSATVVAPPNASGAIELHDDYFTAVRREQLDLRARLQEAIDEIDRNLLAVRTAQGRERRADGPRQSQIQELLRRRATFAADIQRINRSDERGWDETKAEIERDLTPRAPSGTGALPGKI